LIFLSFSQYLDEKLGAASLGQSVDCGDAIRVGVKIELAQRFLTREHRSLDASFQTATGAIVAFSHQLLGAEPTVGHLPACGLAGHTAELNLSNGQSTTIGDVHADTVQHFARLNSTSHTTDPNTGLLSE
jgi:hypothetical protein